MPRWGRRPPTPPEPTPGGKFHITRLDQAAPPGPIKVEPVPAPTNTFAARFTAPADALTFLAAIRDEGARRRPPTMRAPDGACWVVVPRFQDPEVELAWALGGVVHLPDGLYLVSPRGRRCSWTELQSWPAVSWIELASGVRPSASVTEQPEVLVVTTGRLARWIIDRFQAADLAVTVASGLLRSMFRTPSEEWPAVFVHVTPGGRAVSRSSIHAIGGLPHTVVCRLGGGRLLVDQRLGLPLPDADLGLWVPDGEEWLLAGDLGVWNVVERGAGHAPPLHADPMLLPPPVPAPGRLPVDLRVDIALVRDERAQSIDGLLLGDDELTALRRFLTGHPAAERAFLVLGPDRHLYIDPGRSVSDIPFGIPLHRLGPGPLYVEVGHRIRPALPGPARARLFSLDERSLVVLLGDGAHRLSLDRDNMVPTWSLWLGATVDADPAADPLSPSARAMLERVDTAGARVDRPGLTGDLPSAEHADRYAEGVQLEQRGKLAEAARKYWEAGKPQLAARLYEMAAEAEG